MAEGKDTIVYILNGPNLNLLGKRQPEVYGHQTLDDIHANCRDHAAPLGLTVDCRQTNFEGDYITWIHEARDNAAALILNPGAWTHTSVAILDALLAFEGPAIEVHLSNIHRREEFRHLSYVSKGVTGGIFGLGAQGYLSAIDAVASLLKKA